MTSPSESRPVRPEDRVRSTPARENDVLAEICRAIVRGGTPTEVVQECAERLGRYFGTASVGIWFRREDRVVLEGLSVPDAEDPTLVRRVRERWGDIPAAADLPVPRAMRARTILRWAATDSELAPAVRETLTAAGAEWLVAIPVFVDAEPVGAAVLALPGPDDLTATDELLMEQALGVVGEVYTRSVLQEAELRHRERALEAWHMAAVGELAAGVAHEVNNPLGSIHHLLGLILGEAPDEPVAGWAASAVKEAERAARAMDTLRRFARPGSGEVGAVDAVAALEEAISLMRSQLDREGVHVVGPEGRDAPPVRADPDRLRHVVHNVLTNARQAMADDPEGEIRLEVARAGGAVEIVVEDTGPGMSAAVRDALFRPFFTTRERTDGPATGMGLALAWQMVSSWGGEIVAGNWGRPRIEGADDAGEGGARVTIRLPVAEGEPVRRPEPAAPSTGEVPATPPPGLRVLVVEDEEAVGAALATYLRRSGSEAEVTRTAEEALRLLETDAAWDVVITDLRMPGMGGEGLVKAIRDRYPELLERVVVSSGDVVSPGTARWMDESDLPFLAKPYPLESLAALLRRVVGAED